MMRPSANALLLAAVGLCACGGDDVSVAGTSGGSGSSTSEASSGGLGTTSSGPDATSTTGPEPSTGGATETGGLESCPGDDDPAPEGRLVAPLDIRVGAATLEDDGTTQVTVVWSDHGADDLDAVAYDVEVSADGRQWDVAGRVCPGENSYAVDVPFDEARVRVVAVVGEQRAASDALQVHAIADAGYDEASVDVASLPISPRLRGMLRVPTTQTAARPLVVFLHGNHGICRGTGADVLSLAPGVFPPQLADQPTADVCVQNVPASGECPTADFDVPLETVENFRGYVYAQDALAAQGFATLSVDLNPVTCTAYGAQGTEDVPERRALVEAHLERLVAWQAAGEGGGLDAATLGGLDLDQVFVVGHSRGGEVASDFADSGSASATVRGTFAIAPTDFTAPDPQALDFGTLLSSCDGDVVTLDGARHFDRARSGTGREQSLTLLVDGNHNFYNREWIAEWEDLTLYTNPAAIDAECVPADGAEERTSQERALVAVLTSWLETTLGGQPGEGSAWVQAAGAVSPGLATWIGFEMRHAFSSREQAVVDRFADGEVATNELGGANTVEDGTLTACSSNGCSDDFPHEAAVATLAWSGGQSPVVRFELAGVSTDAQQTLSLRLVSSRVAANAGTTETLVRVRVEDGSGVSDWVELPPLGHLYTASSPKEVLETRRVPLASFSDAVDVDNLVAVEVSVGSGDEGEVRITDVELSQ